MYKYITPYSMIEFVTQILTTVQYPSSNEQYKQH